MYHFADKGPYSQSYGFSSSHVWMWELAEHQRIDAFRLRCWRRFLRVPWTARRSNQSILKDINPEYSLEGLMLKLKHQYFGHLTWRANLLEKTLLLGKIEGRVWDSWMPSSTQWTWLEANSGRQWRTGKPGVLPSMGSQRVSHDWVTEQHHQIRWKMIEAYWAYTSAICIISLICLFITFQPETTVAKWKANHLLWDKGIEKLSPSNNITMEHWRTEFHTI